VRVFRFIPGYDPYVVDAGKEAIFLLFLALLLTFALTRLYTRVARVRGWGSGNVGGVHLHHMVPGVILVIGCGLLSFTTWSDSGWAWNLLAIGFGIGAALVLDEFALILHLKDVYWTHEGRSSVDAIIIGLLLAVLCMVATSPFGISDRAEDPSATGFFVAIAASVIFVLITFLKKKIFVGTLGVVFPVVALVGAIRLAKPDSVWAHWLYDPDRARSDRARRRRVKKLERSRRRFQGPLGRIENWFTDLVGGKPSLPTSGSEA
jgi:lysyl-tRNA synthetase, class II